MQRRRTSAIKKTVSEDKTVVESQLDKMGEKKHGVEMIRRNRGGS